MTETRINISELKDEGSDVIKELAKMLEEKTGCKIETGSSEITLESKEDTASRSHMRVLLRKFLHKKELKDYYRVTGGKENELTVRARKRAEEEE